MAGGSVSVGRIVNRWWKLRITKMACKMEAKFSYFKQSGKLNISLVCKLLYKTHN